LLREGIESVSDVVISSGRVFQTRGPATVNARAPTVERLTDRQQERVVPDTAAHFHVKLCTLTLFPAAWTCAVLPCGLVYGAATADYCATLTWCFRVMHGTCSELSLSFVMTSYKLPSGGCLSWWLRAPQRIYFKLAVMLYQCTRGLGPAYLADTLQPVARIPGRQRLRSSSTSALDVPPI